MRKILVCFILFIASSALPNLVLADVPVAWFLVSGEAMCKVARDAIGLVSISNHPDPLALYEAYDSITAGTTPKELSFEETIPFCRFGYRNEDKPWHGNHEYPVVAVRGDAVEIIYNAETGARAWLDLSAEEGSGKIVDLVLFRTVWLGRNRFVEFLPTITEESVPVHKYARSDSDVIGELAIRGPQHLRDLMVLEVRNGFAHVAELISLERIWWESTLKDEKNITGRLREIGWIKLRNDEGELYFWLIYLSRC